MDLAVRKMRALGIQLQGEEMLDIGLHFLRDVLIGAQFKQ
jgi:hypothetical protein